MDALTRDAVNGILRDFHDTADSLEKRNTGYEWREINQGAGEYHFYSPDGFDFTDALGNNCDTIEIAQAFISSFKGL